MVKADAYNHGVNKVAPFTEQIVDRYGVATLKEGVWLRKLGVKKPISVFNCLPQDIKSVKQYDLTPVVYNFNTLRAIASERIEDFDLKIDSGMNRFGFKTIEEVLSVVKVLKQIGLKPRSICTHFASAAAIHAQLSAFTGLIEPLLYCGKVPINVSATSGINQGHYADGVRAGLIAYSGALKVCSEIIAIKGVDKGEGIGYDHAYVAKDNELIAIISGGYYDGIMRSYEGACVNINGYSCPIIGKISMDTTFVKLNVQAKVGDKVIVIDNNTLDSFVRASNASIYEIITSIKGRCERRYYNGQTRDKTTC